MHCPVFILKNEITQMMENKLMVLSFHIDSNLYCLLISRPDDL